MVTMTGDGGGEGGHVISLIRFALKNFDCVKDARKNVSLLLQFCKFTSSHAHASHHRSKRRLWVGGVVVMAMVMAVVSAYF